MHDSWNQKNYETSNKQSFEPGYDISHHKQTWNHHSESSDSRIISMRVGEGHIHKGMYFSRAKDFQIQYSKC